MDLKTISGLPLSLENGKIALSEGAVSLPASYRWPEEAKPYFMRENADFGPGWLYEMARGVCFKKDKSVFEKIGLRYDVTNIRAGTAGKEFIKTIGHFHKDASAEVYEVLSGEALFLFQEIEGGEKVFLIKAESGEKVVILSKFGHVTINPGKGNLIVSDISSTDTRPDYEFFKKNRGAAYYAVKKNGGIKTEKNGNYPQAEELKTGKPKEIPELGISFSKPLYGSFIKNPGKFDFIRNPEKYGKIMLPENLFDFSQ
jgi:glucose-6-phosphate isomerase